MEAFIKFWRPMGKVRREIKTSDPTNGSSAAALADDPAVELGEGDDSFFELELSLSDFSSRGDKNDNNPETKPSLVSSSDHFSKNKVIPVEVGPNKPHSPIAILKSGPKFRAFSFKKFKAVDAEKSTPAAMEKKESKSLNVRFSIEDGRDENTGGFSFRNTASIARPQHDNDTVFDATASSSSSSKRFFTLIKPFYAKTAKKQSNKDYSNAPAASPASSPAMVLMGKERQQRSNNVSAGIRIVRRHLGKSRSASAAVGGSVSPANRVVGESLWVQEDGIQSAILHCKRSFHGSRESSLLSRTTSDSSSLEKLSTSSSEDSYVFSRIASDSTSEKSTDRQQISLP